MSPDPNPNGSEAPADPPSSDDGAGRRLPPPAFPPGMKISPRRRSTSGAGDMSSAFISPDEPLPDRGEGVPDDAFISPDAPIERVRRPEAGFISPDEPIPHRAPRTGAVAMVDDFDPDQVVVTGIGDDAHLDPRELAVGFDPHVLEVVQTVGKLAEALKRKGEAGLRSTPDMSRFEATLRSYCVGYLAGRRAEDGES